MTANRREFLLGAAALAVATTLRAADRASIGVQFFSFNRVAGEAAAAAFEDRLTGDRVSGPSLQRRR